MISSFSRRDWLDAAAPLAGTLALPRGARRPSPTPTPLAVLRHVPEPATLRLCFNENPHGPPASAVRAAEAALRRANRYADQEEFDALAALIAEREGVTPAHVLLGTGSSELLGLAAVAFLQEGGELVTADPAFPHIVNLAERIGARIRRVPLDLNGVHDLDAMAGAVGAETRLVNVCNPNNPTGTILPGDRLGRSASRCPRRAPVLVDEAYHELVDAPEHATMVPLVREGAPVLVLRTFSKVYGMAGYRVGYAIAPSALIERLRVHQTTDLGPAPLAAATAAYGTAHSWSGRGGWSARRASSRRTGSTSWASATSRRTRASSGSSPAPRRRDLPVWLHARGVRISWDVKPLTGDWARVSIGTAAEMRRFLRELREVWG